jgi:hypothetical protein
MRDVITRRRGMRGIIGITLLLVSPLVHAQYLLGTWHSNEPLLISVKFSLQFRESEYQVDCTLGQTIGTYDARGDTIYFTPTKIGIDSGSVGKNDVWRYERIDENSFYLSSGWIRVKLMRIPP